MAAGSAPRSAAGRAWRWCCETKSARRSISPAVCWSGRSLAGPGETPCRWSDHPASVVATLLAGCGLLATSPAAAHVTLEVQQAQAGAAFKAVFRVPHGCGGAATVRVHVVLPEGSLDARPMPKPGWSLRTVRRPLAEPVPDGHGGEMRETTAEVVWEGGRLEDGITTSSWCASGLRTGPARRSGFR